MNWAGGRAGGRAGREGKHRQEWSTRQAGGGRALTAVEHVGAALALHGVGVVQTRYCHEGLFAKEINFFRAGLRGAAATTAAVAVTACAGAAASNGGSVDGSRFGVLDGGIQLLRAVSCRAHRQCPDVGAAPGGGGPGRSGSGGAPTRRKPSLQAAFSPHHSPNQLQGPFPHQGVGSEQSLQVETLS